ncbi:uncharacterized protein LOC134278145 isoform X2 [Saccostrea cucullata]|uniref:uncharacterized protein LOC134278145 isoform X2 n=1 Tax=Saccostrea cuccullata TaxID=36930 RepID=UPI002ED327D8
MGDQDLFRGKKQVWKIDGNWHLDKQFIRVCKCESTGTVLDPYHCTRCTDTFASYLDYLSHTCTPQRLYQCCSCRHLYGTEEEFDSHDCRPCRYPSDSVDDYAYSDTSIGGEIDLPLETMKHTNSPGIFSASAQENSDGLLQKIKKEEIDSDADSSQTEEMEGDTDNGNMTDLHDNEGGLHAMGLESASHSQDHQATSASNGDIATESQEQALQEAGVLQDKNKRRQEFSPAIREKRVTGTRVRKRKQGREHWVIKQDVEGLNEVILSQIAGEEGGQAKEGVTRESLISEVVNSEIQRTMSTKWKNGREETEAGDPMTGSEGEMDLSVVKTDKHITELSRNSLFTTSCSEEVSHSQSGPHNESPEVPLIESNEKEDSRGEKEMHRLSKSSRNTAAGSGQSEAKLVFQKLGISNIPNPGKEFKVFKLMASDPFKDAKSTSIVSPVQHPKPVTSTPTKGVRNNRSLIKLLSTPPTDYTSQHALQTSLLPCNNVFSPFANSNVPSSSQTGQNPDSVMRGFASASGLSTLTNDSISTSQQEENTDSQFSEEGPDISIVKSEQMYESDNDSEHVDDVPQTPNTEMEPTITNIKSEPMDDYSYNVPPTQVTNSDHAVEGQRSIIKSEPMDSMFDVPQTQDNYIDSTIEGQNPIIKNEPIDDSYNFSAGYSVNQNDTPEAIEESILFTNLKKEPENDSSNFTQNQYDIPRSGVTAKGYGNLTAVKTEPGEESSDLSSCYSDYQNVLHSQVSEEKQNLAIVNAVNAALENSGIPPELLYGENEREQTLPTEKRTGSDTGQFWLYNCKTCGKKFKHAGTLMVHERAHNLEKKQYQCFICGRICTAASYLKVHLRTHKEEPSDTTKRKIQCFKCDEQFLHEKNFQTHMRMHFQKGLTYCIKCGKGFYRKNQLDKHMENHTDKYPCKHCGREFSSQAGRTIHLNSHNKEKQTSKHPTEI